MHQTVPWLSALLLFSPAVLSPPLLAQAAVPDIILADFEGDDYGEWTSTGTAFGPGPAEGALPGQMAVSGYEGKRLVNTFFGGDDSVGTLTSPPITVERDYLQFLIGGGAHEGETCINLLLDGEIVRTAAGPNDTAGGSEALTLQAWDVKELKGRKVLLQIVDRARGGWGHVNVDQVVLTDILPKVPPRPGRLAKEWVLDQKYLLFPIRHGARKARIDLEIVGKHVREFDAELAVDAGEISFWSFLDVTAFQGSRATLKVNGITEAGLALIRGSDELPGGPDLYNEPLRPQFHFSQRLGWINDPNGMVYYDGEWHLYFQHNPYGWDWGNMHWGHAVSRDLVHWEQLPIAIYNPKRGDWAFSGGAVIDEHDTAGWQTGKEKVIVASWTSTGRGECLSYSNDRGRTFTEFEGNPVVKHKGRDPKIIWYEPGRHWVMIVYNEDGGERALTIHTSKDLKEWKLQSRLPGFFECPELVELAVDGGNEKRWVVFAADARYVIGRFDGKTFTPDHENKHTVHHGDYYASQLFNNTPDGRVIQIGWARIAMPGMPFNQTFSFPHQLTLRTTPEGIRLFAEPIPEIEKLHGRKQTVRDRMLTEGQPVTVRAAGDLFDIRATFAVGSASSVGLEFGGERVVYDVQAASLNGAALTPVDSRVTIQVLVDRPMIEICGNRGRVYITGKRNRPGAVPEINAFAKGGEARLVDLDVHELKSIWNR